MAIEWDQLQRLWPAELFLTEALALVHERRAGDDDLGWLLDEAFQDGLAREWWREQGPADPRDWPRVLPGDEVVKGYAEIEGTLRQLATVAVYQPPRLWSARRTPEPPPPLLSPISLRRELARRVGHLDATGYFEQAFGSHCADSDDDPDATGQRRLAELVSDDLTWWPMWADGESTGAAESWADEPLFDVLEALHLFVSRPRRRHWHGYHDSYDYADHTRSAGQAVYRWQVNELLTRADLPWRLADAGPDRGHLVEVTTDGREDLVRQLLEPAPDGVDRLDPTERATVAHAVELFRARGASREAKRSAIVALAGVLEQRRGLLQVELLRGDEKALFHIANQFDLRHRNGRQHDDYSEHYLDWIFWCYLATVDLTNRVLRAQTPTVDVRHRQPSTTPTAAAT